LPEIIIRIGPGGRRLTLTQKEIDRPLGQADASRRRPIRLSLAPHLPLLVTAIVVVGLSSAIAFRESPFRRPQPVVTTVPEQVVAEPATPGPTQPPATSPPRNPAPGPQIIRVEPGASLPTNRGIVVRDPSALGQNLRVAHLPDRDLIEETPDGPLPVRAADGRRPMDVYARPWSGARGARIAIVIGGFAISQTGTQAAIQSLPPEVTMAFSPQGNSINRWMQAARQKGHEILMQVPLEPFDYPNVDPGRNTLTVDSSPDENLRKLHWALSRTTNYTGVMNFMGALFLADGAAMQPIFADLGKRGLLYLDDGSSARSTAPEVALSNGVAFAAGDGQIDSTRDRGAILKKLDELERIARAKGYAIGTGSAFAETVDAVSSWVQEAKKRGIEIVPVSALVSDPER